MWSDAPNPEVVQEVFSKPSYTSNPNPNITNFKTKSDPLNSPFEVLRTNQDVHTTQKCSYVTSRMSTLVVNIKDVEEHAYTHHPSHCVYSQ